MKYIDIAFQKDKEIQELNGQIKTLKALLFIATVIIIALVLASQYALTGSII